MHTSWWCMSNRLASLRVDRLTASKCLQALAIDAAKHWRSWLSVHQAAVGSEQRAVAATHRVVLRLPSSRSSVSMVMAWAGQICGAEGSGRWRVGTSCGQRHHSRRDRVVCFGTRSSAEPLQPAAACVSPHSLQGMQHHLPTTPRSGSLQPTAPRHACHVAHLAGDAAHSAINEAHQQHAHRLAQLAGDAALLASGVAAQRVLATEARRQRALLKGVVDLRGAQPVMRALLSRAASEGGLRLRQHQHFHAPCVAHLDTTC